MNGIFRKGFQIPPRKNEYRSKKKNSLQRRRRKEKKTIRENKEQVFPVVKQLLNKNNFPFRYWGLHFRRFFTQPLIIIFYFIANKFLAVAFIIIINPLNKQKKTKISFQSKETSCGITPTSD